MQDLTGRRLTPGEAPHDGLCVVFRRVGNPLRRDETTHTKDISLEIAAVIPPNQCVRAPWIEEYLGETRESVRRALQWLYSQGIDIRYVPSGRCWIMSVDPTVPWREATVGDVVDQRLVSRAVWVPLKLALQSGVYPFGEEQVLKDRLV